MTIASTSKTRVAYVPEASFGAGTPTTPTFQTFRRTGGQLQTTKGTAVSDEIQADRNVRDEYQLSQDVRGSYDFEVTYATLDDLIANAMHAAWASNVIVNGTTDTSLTFEETLDVGGGSFAYSRYSGCVVDQLDLTIASRQAIKGTATIMGLQEVTDTAIVTGATYTAANTNAVMTAATDFASLTFEGLTSPKVKQLALKLANSTRVRDVVGSLYSQPFGFGQFDLTGTIDLYFESNALYQKVLAHDETGALSLTLGSVTTKKYTMVMPKIVLLNGAKTIGGKNNDVMVSVPIRSVYDSGIGGSLQITRAVA